MKLLVDAVFPTTVEAEAPAGVEVHRWSRGEASDKDLLRAAAHQDARAVVFSDRRSVYQPGLRELAEELGVAIIVIEGGDPVDAKDKLFRNLDGIREALRMSLAILVLAHEARPISFA